MIKNMDEIKLNEKIKELEHNLELERQANNVLKEGYETIFKQFTELVTEFENYKKSGKELLDNLHASTVAAIEDYNAKARKLNELLSSIDDEKLAEKISEIFASENKNNQKEFKQNGC